jgi:hypothetical protein
MRLKAINQFPAIISYTDNLIRSMAGKHMTIFKLSMAAFAALIVGAWAEGAKAGSTNAVASLGVPLTSLTSRIG